MSNSISIIKTSYDHLATIYADKLHTYMHVLGLFTILYGKSGSDVQDVMVVLSRIETNMLSFCFNHLKYNSKEHLQLNCDYIKSFGFILFLDRDFQLHTILGLTSRYCLSIHEYFSKSQNNQTQAIFSLSKPSLPNFVYQTCTICAHRLQDFFAMHGYNI